MAEKPAKTGLPDHFCCQNWSSCTNFGCQNWSPLPKSVPHGGTILVKLSAKNGPPQSGTFIHACTWLYMNAAS